MALIGARAFALVLAAGAMAAAADLGLAQPYPSRPIRFISPQPPAGTFDYVTRAFAERLSAGMGQPVIVENRAGAALVVGLDHTARQAPDGHTIVMSASTHAIMPNVMAKLPFDPVKSFDPVSLVAVSFFALAVRADAPMGNVQEYIAYAKANPGKVTFGSSGIGSPLHFAGELMKSMAGIDILHVPYKGANPVVQAMLSGELFSTFGPVTPMLPHIRSGKFRVLGMVGSTRTQILPDLPTISESGLKGFALDSWFGVFAPAGTPLPVVNRLNAEFNRIARDPQFVREKLLPAGIEGAGSTPEHLMDVLKADIAKYAKIVKEAKIPPQ
ncbi:MAG: tripartite tricarboxylate transporter substrate binding protein [Burkholderiales bacterium]|nr:tripartite tricarboxylate transporter substrate binding protein [Burkholderiales bacterium]